MTLYAVIKTTQEADTDIVVLVIRSDCSSAGVAATTEAYIFRESSLKVKQSSVLIARNCDESKHTVLGFKVDGEN